MPATWVELRDFAKAQIKDSPCSELHARCSISRAYYAAFHALEPLCRKVPSPDPPEHGAGGLGHKQVPARMAKLRGLSSLHGGTLASVSMAGRTLAPTYSQALRARRLADYELDEDVDEEAAKLQLLRVKDLLEFAVQVDTAFKRLGI